MDLFARSGRDKYILSPCTSHFWHASNLFVTIQDQQINLFPILAFVLVGHPFRSLSEPLNLKFDPLIGLTGVRPRTMDGRIQSVVPIAVRFELQRFRDANGPLSCGSDNNLPVHPRYPFPLPESAQFNE